MSHLRKRAGYLLAAIALILSMAGVLAEVSAQPAKAGGFGVCSILQNGQYRTQSGRLYECRYIRGVGWLWIYIGTYPGCAATRLHIIRTC